MEEVRHSSSGLEFKLHPLVLINISDHHTRVKANQGSPSLVMGCLLGSQTGRVVDVSNSFELLYTSSAEGLKIDEPFFATKQEQYKTVFPKLDVVGWYVTGPKLTDEFRQIHKKIMETNEGAALLLLDPVIQPARRDLPVTLYESETHSTEMGHHLVFVHATYTVETSDAERIAVDQVAKILPSGKASGSQQLTAHLNSLHSAIKMLRERGQLLEQVLVKMEAGEIPFDHSLVRKISSLVNSLPALDSPAFHNDYVMSYSDTLLTIYLSSMTKGLHTLNEMVDKSLVAFEGKPRRRGGGGIA